MVCITNHGEKRVYIYIYICIRQYILKYAPLNEQIQYQTKDFFGEVFNLRGWHVQGSYCFLISSSL